MFMVQYGYEDNIDLMGVWMQCTSCSRNVHCNISDSVGKDTIPVFLKYVLFYRCGISWLIQTKEKIYFDDDK